MSVSSTTNQVIYTGSGTTGPFDFTFKIFVNTDLVITKYTIADGTTTTLVLTTDYTVTIDGENGGEVNLISALSSAYKLIITRTLPLTQTTNYVENDPFPAETHEEALDRAAMRDQQLQEQIDRCVQIGVGSGATGSLPAASADKILGWNSAATALENKTPGDLSSAFDITLVGGDAYKLVRVNSGGTGYELLAGTAYDQIFAMASKIMKLAKGADVASASTMTLGDDGNFFDITGTTGITSITIKAAGTVVMLQFDGVLTLTDGGNLKLNGSFTTAAESALILVSDGTNWYEMSRVSTASSAVYPKFLATMGSAQSISSATDTKCDFDTEAFDTNSYYDTTNKRFTPLVSGYYYFITYVYYGTTVDQKTIQAKIFKNGSEVATNLDSTSGTNGLTVCISDIISMNGTTDYVEAYTKHDMGAGITLSNAPGFSRFMGFKLY